MSQKSLAVEINKQIIEESMQKKTYRAQLEHEWKNFGAYLEEARSAFEKGNLPKGPLPIAIVKHFGGLDKITYLSASRIASLLSGQGR